MDRHELVRSGSRGRGPPRRAAAAARTRAGSRSGSRARTSVPARTIPVAPPTIVPCTKSVSITRRPKRAEASRPAARTTRVVELVEVPLVARGSGAARGKRSTQPRPWSRAGAGRRRRRGRCRRCEISAADREADPLGAGRWARRGEPRVGEGRLEEVLDHVVDPRDRDAAADDREQRERRPSPPSSATRARRCGARARGSPRRCPPARRSSGSSARRGRGGRPRARRASGTGVAEEDAEHHPERVEGGEERADVAERRRARRTSRRG